MFVRFMIYARVIKHIFTTALAVKKGVEVVTFVYKQSLMLYYGAEELIFDPYQYGWTMARNQEPRQNVKKFGR